MVRAMMDLPAYVVYTGFSLGVVLITYAANALVLHERLDRRDHVAIVLVLVALVLINLPR
jgi:multidrug transporter EmrE-like cation transporter